MQSLEMPDHFDLGGIKGETMRLRRLLSVVGEGLAIVRLCRLAHQRLIVRLSTASAASCSASDRVGCAWTMRAMSSEAGAEFHRHYGFRDQFGCVRTDHVHAEDAVGLGICEHFHEARWFHRWRGRGR